MIFQIIFLIFSTVFANENTSDALNFRILIAEACVLSSALQHGDHQIFKETIRNQIVHWENEISLIHTPAFKSTMTRALDRLRAAIENDQTDLDHEVFKFVECAGNLLCQTGGIRKNLFDRFTEFSKKFNEFSNIQRQCQISFETNIPPEYSMFESTVKEKITSTMNTIFANRPNDPLGAHFIIKVENLKNLKTRIKATLNIDVEIIRDHLTAYAFQLRTIHYQHLTFIHLSDGLDTLANALKRQVPMAIEFFDRQPKPDIVTELEECHRLLTDVIVQI